MRWARDRPARHTSQQIGGAIGVAIASTVAATHFTTLTHAGATAPTALTGGFQWALWVCGAIGLAAIPSPSCSSAATTSQAPRVPQTMKSQPSPPPPNRLGIAIVL
jgi:hypothetical protein